jgi:hypothetical protein
VRRDDKEDGVVVSVGGFLGMGEHNVMMTMDKIRFSNEANKTTTGSISSGSKQWYPDKGTVRATKDQLKAMQEFKYWRKRPLNRGLFFRAGGGGGAEPLWATRLQGQDHPSAFAVLAFAQVPMRGQNLEAD